MSRAFRGVVFTGVFALIYLAVYAPKLPVMLHYPQLGKLSFGGPLSGAGTGPAMYWFGWVAISLLGAVLVAGLLPARWLKPGWLPLSWLAPAVLMIYVVVHEWHWFTRSAPTAHTFESSKTVWGGVPDS